MMVLQLPNQLSPGELARRLGVPLHRINHILATRNIVPIGRVGIVRIYAPEVEAAVKAELELIHAKRNREATT